MENSTSEIIYISSDDDENVQQNKNKNQESIVEQVKVNDAHVCKTEIIEDKNVCKIINEQKRKFSEMNNDDEVNGENSVNISEEERSMKIRSLEMEGEKEYVKPKLIEKERKSVCSEGQNIFNMFISLCLQRDRSEDMRSVVNKLNRRYEQLDHEYADSLVFRNFLNEKRNDIFNSKDKLYVHIAEVMNEIKNRSRGKSTLFLNSKSCSDMKNMNKTDTLKASTSYENNSMSNNEAGVSHSDENDDEDQHVRRKIRKLEKAMKICQRQIKKLEEAEVDFDDDNNSSYIKEARYKTRMIELFNKYCEYTGENMDAGRQLLRPKHFSPTGIVAVDHAITSFINSRILKRKKVKKISAFTKALVFPDYHDILQCVRKCNETNNLCLNNKKQEQLAKKAFTEIGEHLQLCRKNDYWDTFSMFLENREDDPAMKDHALGEQLKHNKLEGEKKLANVIQEYVEKQEKMKDEIVDSKTSSEKEDEIGSEEEVEDEDEDEDEEVESDEDDYASETDTNLNVSNCERISIDRKEKNVDVTQILESKTNVNLIKTRKTKQQVNDTLKDNNNSPKPEKVNDSQEVSNYENMNDPELIVEKDATSSNLKTQSNTLPIVTNNDIQIDEAIEEKSFTVIDDASHKIMQPKDELMDEIQENGKDDKPLLRVRSFAKPPTTWEDNQGKMDKKSENQLRTPIDIVDLTENSSKENLTVFHKKVPTESNMLSKKMKVYKLMVPLDKNKKRASTYVTPVSSSHPSNLEQGEIAPRQRIAGKRTTAQARIIQVPVNQRKSKHPHVNPITSRVIGNEIHPQSPRLTYTKKPLPK